MRSGFLLKKLEEKFLFFSSNISEIDYLSKVSNSKFVS